MEEITLKATTRTILGKKVKQLRAKGLIPAELYGHNVPNKHLSIDEKEFLRVYKKAGENTLVYIELENEKIPALIADVNYNYLTNKIQNVDFHQVKMDEKIEAEIPIELKGESPAIKKGLTVVKVLNEIKVSAIPSKLPHSFEIDISSLSEAGEKITVNDLKTNKDVKIIASPDTVIAAVVEPEKEETLPSTQTTTSSSTNNT